MYRTPKPPGKGVIGDGEMYPSHLLGESVTSDPGLQLGRGLVTPLEVALLKAPVDTDGHVVRDLEENRTFSKGSKHANPLRVGLTPVARLTTSSMPTSPRVAATTSGGRPKTSRNGPISAPITPGNNKIWILTSLGNLTGTWVLVVKGGDESERLTAGVDLVMDGTLGENGSLTWGQSVDDEASSVLLDEPDFHVAVNEVKELGRPRMGMRGVHSARSGERFALG